MKCFSCSEEAVVMANACSPTSATGLSETRPRCGDCYASMVGANIVERLVPNADDLIILGVNRMACRDHFFTEHKLKGNEKHGCFDHMEYDGVLVRCVNCKKVFGGKK